MREKKLVVAFFVLPVTLFVLFLTTAASAIPVDEAFTGDENTFSVDKNFAAPGDVLTYTMAYKNNSETGITGPDSDVFLGAVLPDDTTFVPGSIFHNGAGVPDAEGYKAEEGSGAIEIKIDELPAQASGILTFKVKINETTPSGRLLMSGAFAEFFTPNRYINGFGLVLTEVGINLLGPGVRVWGNSSPGTSVAISQKGWPKGTKLALVARDDYFTDALAGGPLAQYLLKLYEADAPVLLTNQNTLTAETKAEIIRLGVERIYLLGGPGAVNYPVEDALNDIPGVDSVVRLWGQTAYGTARKIKEEMDLIAGEATKLYGVEIPPPEIAIITTGENFPDALVISGPAAASEMPVLLVKPLLGEPPPETKQALAGIKGVIIVGGPGAVHPNLEDWLNDNGHFVIERLWGNTAYDTAINVATTGSSIFSFNDSAVIITRGDYFTDALSGGSFAATIGTIPMVLVDTHSVPLATKLWLQGAASQIRIAYILGGPGAVSADVFGQVEGLVK